MKSNNSVPRPAIYARYSSSLQNPTSVDDQIDLCRVLIERQFAIAPPDDMLIFSDSAMSGSTLNRPGIRGMLAAAEAGKFDLLVAEGLDRISRSLKDIATIYEQLVYYGVAIWTAHEDNVGALHVGMKGTMNAIYLDDMKEKVRRGQGARVKAGYAPSCPPYGYRVVRGVFDEKKRHVNGIREIDPAQVAVVVRIFEEFAAGEPTKEIVRRLNDDGILSPAGKLWKPSTLLGSRPRKEGLLRNELYRGVLVYNRTRLVTNPITHRKKYIPNPESEWVRTAVPELRIVDDALWERVRERDTERAKKRTKKKPKPRPPGFTHNQRPLTGLIKCGVCGGKKSIANDSRYLCSTNRYARKCRNARGTRENIIKNRVFLLLNQRIENDPYVVESVGKVHQRQCVERDRNAASPDIS